MTSRGPCQPQLLYDSVKIEGFRLSCKITVYKKKRNQAKIESVGFIYGLSDVYFLGVFIKGHPIKPSYPDHLY